MRRSTLQLSEHAWYALLTGYFKSDAIKRDGLERASVESFSMAGILPEARSALRYIPA
jgi:hypothetical protein